MSFDSAEMAAARCVRVATGIGRGPPAEGRVPPASAPRRPPPPFSRTQRPLAYAALLLRPPTTVLTGVARACRIKILLLILLHAFPAKRQGTSRRQFAVKGCHNPTPCWTRQIQARPNQPWTRSSVFILPPASRGQSIKISGIEIGVFLIHSSLRFGQASRETQS